ncbi:MAG: hypothetical protein HYX78_13865 [Armatimonadetes bacterium]|nr:hypothetical protein [Armatimonadota bacterium]
MTQTACGQVSSADAVLDRCPTLARLAAEGKLDQIKNPVFTDRDAARQFAGECAKVKKELQSLLYRPAQYDILLTQAALAAEFLTGDTYLLSTSKIKSAVKLREWVKIPPPPGFVYVKKYASTSAMPPIVEDVFDQLASSEMQARVQGVNIRGRYIALLETEYHDELVDNLAHEMVHAYLTLASGVDLPSWFHEGAAVYFSIGKESRLYGKTGDPKIKQVTVPESYKRDLYSFDYIERKIGRKKLFEFVKESVETGQVDARAALGLNPLEKPDGPDYRRVALAAAIGVGTILLLIVAWLVSRRQENWVD